MGGYQIKNQNAMHFITPTLVGWIDIFSRKIYKEILVESLQYCIENKGLIVYSYVIMTNHIHLVCAAKSSFALSDIIRDFKKFTSKRIIKEILTNQIESRQEWMLKLFKYYAKFNKNNTTYQLWKRDNHPVELVSNEWISSRINYIHQNPVRAGYVFKPENYVYSSASNYLELPSRMNEVEVYNFGIY